MKERPILFSAPMVKAILEGRKTQTRRVVKPQPEKTGEGWVFDCKYFVGDDDMRDYLFHSVYGDGRMPYGGVYGDGTADRLWVRETFFATEFPKRPLVSFGRLVETPSGYASVYYRADGSNMEDGSWKPSIHMPRWASRLTLEITAVRVERVQEISGYDICRELGFPPEYPGPGPEPYPRNLRQPWIDTWDGINGQRPGCAWGDNPWVWCISFRRIDAR